MRDRPSIALVIGMTLLVPVLEDSASARSVSALSGHARIGSAAHCFAAGGLFSTMAIQSTCSNADFIVPLTVDRSGTKDLLFTSRAATAGSLCRVVANNPTGTAVSASSFVPIPVGPDVASSRTGSVAVPAAGVFFADCVTKLGTEFYEFDYTP